MTINNIVINGESGVGKTYLSSTLPNSILVDFDNLAHKAGIYEGDVYKIPKEVDGKGITHVQRYKYYTDFVQALTMAKNGKDKPGMTEMYDDLVACEYVILDTLTSLEHLIIEYTKQVNPSKFKSITGDMIEIPYAISIGVGAQIAAMIKELNDVGVTVVANTHTKYDEKLDKQVPNVNFELKRVLESSFEMIGYLYQEEGRYITFNSEKAMTKGGGKELENPESLYTILQAYSARLEGEHAAVSSAVEMKKKSREAKTCDDVNELMKEVSKLPNATKIAMRKYVFAAASRLTCSWDNKKNKYVQVQSESA